MLNIEATGYRATGNCTASLIRPNSNEPPNFGKQHFLALPHHRNRLPLLIVCCLSELRLVGSVGHGGVRNAW